MGDRIGTPLFLLLLLALLTGPLSALAGMAGSDVPCGERSMPVTDIHDHCDHPATAASECDGSCGPLSGCSGSVAPALPGGTPIIAAPLRPDFPRAQTLYLVSCPLPGPERPPRTA